MLLKSLKLSHWYKCIPGKKNLSAGLFLWKMPIAHGYYAKLKQIILNLDVLLFAPD